MNEQTLELAQFVQNWCAQNVAHLRDVLEKVEAGTKVQVGSDALELTLNEREASIFKLAMSSAIGVFEKLPFTLTPRSSPQYIEVQAQVSHWDSATINGQPDEQGTLTPLRNGELWAPVIRLDGQVMDWPQGTEAQIHFKVCDAGEYWLLDEQRNRIAKWDDHYVPDRFLCHGDEGYGDYIILNINKDGQIENWTTPDIDDDEWEVV